MPELNVWSAVRIRAGENRDAKVACAEDLGVRPRFNSRDYYITAIVACITGRPRTSGGCEVVAGFEFAARWRAATRTSGKSHGVHASSRSLQESQGSQPDSFPF